MSHKPPSDDERDPGPQPEPSNLSDEQVQDAFAELTAEYRRQSLPGPRDYIADDVDEPFTPPDPGPIASSDVFLTLGWGLLGGGLLVILLSLMLWPSAPRTFHIGCAVAVVIGGAILTWRMPRHRRDDDDDLGAVV